MITHSVFFTLKHPQGSAAEAEFLRAANVLVGIPGVRNFAKLKEVSPKNDFHFGFTMQFENQQAYDGYNIHPDHVAFVNNRWIPEVKRFQEIDHVTLV